MALQQVPGHLTANSAKKMNAIHYNIIKIWTRTNFNERALMDGERSHTNYPSCLLATIKLSDCPWNIICCPQKLYIKKKKYIKPKNKKNMSLLNSQRKLISKYTTRQNITLKFVDDLFLLDRSITTIDDNSSSGI